MSEFKVRIDRVDSDGSSQPATIEVPKSIVSIIYLIWTGLQIQNSSALLQAINCSDSDSDNNKALTAWAQTNFTFTNGLVPLGVLMQIVEIAKSEST